MLFLNKIPQPKIRAVTNAFGWTAGLNAGHVVKCHKEALVILSMLPTHLLDPIII